VRTRISPRGSRRRATVEVGAAAAIVPTLVATCGYRF